MNKSKNKHYYRITLKDALTPIGIPLALRFAQDATANPFANRGGEC